MFNRPLIWYDILILETELGDDHRVVITHKSLKSSSFCNSVDLKIPKNVKFDALHSPSVIWQKGESQDGGSKKAKHAKFPKKR